MDRMQHWIAAIDCEIQMCKIKLRTLTSRAKSFEECKQDADKWIREYQNRSDLLNIRNAAVPFFFAMSILDSLEKFNNLEYRIPIYTILKKYLKKQEFNDLLVKYEAGKNHGGGG